MRALRPLALASVVLTYCLIILGGWVRSTNSGLSCPDWPTCYGEWVLTPGAFAALGEVGYTYGQVMLEWTHRLIAGVFLGPLILLVAVIAFCRRKVDRAGWRLALAILVVLLIQAKLGGLTVLDANSAWSVALHLGNALLLLSLLVLFTLRLLPATAFAAPEPAFWRPFLFCLWALVIATMITAAMTAKSGASLACYEWPACTGGWLPDLGDPQIRIHFLHRVLAASTGLGILAFLVLAFRGDNPILRGLAAIVTLLVLAQIGLGALVIVHLVPTSLAVAHQAVGVLLFTGIAAALATVLLTPTDAPTREPPHVGLRDPRAPLQASR
jgi:cytochrome c oxidase assembly protein subunit 15